MLVTALLTALLISPAPVEAATTLPAGFTRVGRPSGQGPYKLTAFAPLPDNAMLTAGKDGTVTYVSPEDAVRVVARIPARNTGDVGLVGLTLAMDYAETGRIYTVYAYTSSIDGRGYHRLSSWTVDDPAAPTRLLDERVVLDGITTDTDVHGMTDVVTEADGTLWVSIGDASQHTSVDPTALRALDVDDPHGKLLRVRPDGSGVPDNPYYDAAHPSSWRSRVFASGFRSPFRFTFDPRTGAVVLGDVGWYSYEEINVVRKGDSYGWPCWEGNAPTPGYRDLPACRGVAHAAPAVAYSPSAGRSVTGGVFYTGEAWPQQYRNTYLFGDYVTERQWALGFDNRGRLTSAHFFGNEIGGSTQYRIGPNGDVMYSDLKTSKVWRIRYQPGNRPPEVEVTTSTDPLTRTVSFDASASTDLDGDRLVFNWDFGDPNSLNRNSATGARVSHTYLGLACCYTARLTVTDAAGAAGAVTKTVTVKPSNHGPRLSLAPVDVEHRVGDRVAVDAAASDHEDGDLTEKVQWAVDLLHCRETVCHSHPQEAETKTGRLFRTTFPDHGGDVRMKVTATVADSDGVVATEEFVARPDLRRLSVKTSAPAAVTMNGQAQQSALVTVGSRNLVQVADTASDGVATFDRWSDGSTSERHRVVVMPGEDVTLTANYATPIDRRLAELQAMLGPPVEPEQGDSSVRWRRFERGRAYWSPATGVRVVHGMILHRYLQLGGHLGFGVPTTDETGTPDGIGRFNHFTGGSIYWTPYTGAHEVFGAIRWRWQELGSERSVLGYPVTGELGTPDGMARFNHFTGGSIYWTPYTGAHEVFGAIRWRWFQLGAERSYLGYPVTGELGTPDGIGRFNHFRAGSIYWTPYTGAHEVFGAIRWRWFQLGAERGYLGYPISGEYSIPGGRRSDFQRGYVVWYPHTGPVDRRW